MSLRILITGTTGDAMPPPYGGIPKVSLLYARTWKKMGNDVAVTFVYKPENGDDHGAGADYFFEYESKPTKFQKILFLIKYFFRNPVLYFSLLRSYMRIYPMLSREVILYPAYGVFMDTVMEKFKPDIILSQAALIKTFMAAEVAKRRNIPVVYNTYAEVHDQRQGVNKDLNKEQQKKYWTYLLNLADLVIGMDNCSIGPLMYLPKEKVQVFWDCCDYQAYQVKLPETKNQLRDGLHLPHDRFLVAMVGAFHYRKGHDHLIKAVGILKKQGFNIGATICGGSRNPEEDLKKWRALAKEQDVDDRIYFFSNFGEQELVRLHRSVDLYANLSNSTRSCGLDLALLEAMSSGLPIVVYDNGALPNAVPGGKNGIIVKTHDISALAEAIKKIYEMQPEARAEMAQKSKEFAAKIDVMITGEIKLNWFKEIIAARSR